METGVGYFLIFQLFNMKFIPVEKAKVPFHLTVFVEDNLGHHHAAKLLKEEKTPDGIVKTFELATFDASTKSTSDIKAVAVPK